MLFRERRPCTKLFWCTTRSPQRGVLCGQLSWATSLSCVRLPLKSRAHAPLELQILSSRWGLDLDRDRSRPNPSWRVCSGGLWCFRGLGTFLFAPSCLQSSDPTSTSTSFMTVSPASSRPNIFLSKAEGGHAKLGDFGLSTELAACSETLYCCAAHA